MTTGRIATVNQLTYNDLTSLFDGESCILVVKGFCPSETAERLSSWLLGETRERYDHEVHAPSGVTYVYYGVDRVGIPFNKAFGEDERKKAYYAQAPIAIRAMRAACTPLLSPIDQLRLILDEVWPDGAGIAAFEGKKMFAGIGRIMRSENSPPSEIPHFDSTSPRIVSLRAQIAANIYVEMPDIGGELEVWDVPPIPFGTPTPPEHGEDWRATLPEPIRVRPEIGDLVLFNAGCPHAIRRFSAGVRISVQCFLGVRDGHRLDLWD